MPAKIKRRAVPRHPFRFKINTPDGGSKVMTILVKTVRARKKVLLTLTAEHVRKSMTLGGVGNTSLCSGALCVQNQKEAFPHPVDGFVDWQYRTAYVVSETSTESGMPLTCVAYEHHSNFAKFQDSKDGQKRLLAHLTANGPLSITLLPPKPRYGQPKRRPEGKRDGTRTTVLGHGAKLRFAVASMGGAPQENSAVK